MKRDFVAVLRGCEIPSVLDDTDSRIRAYIEHVATHVEGDDDVHNIYEVAACVKFLRLFERYDFQPEAVQRFILLYESLYFSGLKGRRRYAMTPIQVFITAGIFGFWTRDDEPRRVVREAILFIPRKFAKTTFLAALALNDFLFGDANGEVYMVANNLDQAKIAYKEAKAAAKQYNKGDRFRFTARQFNWNDNPLGRSNSVTALTAGGQTKDGLFASLCLVDEYGSAPYVKGESSMADSVNAVETSMGPRPNPLTVIATTAGRVSDGPFERKLRIAQDALLEGDLDWQFLIDLQPDLWECDDEHFADPRVQLKCNPHIGVTVQSDYYQVQWQKALADPEVYKDVVTKLYNQFVSGQVHPWMQASEVRELQIATRVDDLRPEDGWSCYVGMDFSDGNDLCGMGYVMFRWIQDESGERLPQWYIDCDMWIAEDMLEGHANGRFYRELVEQGYLRTCPGMVIDETMVCDRMEEVSKKVNVAQIGYDAYDAKRFANTLEAWLQMNGRNPKYVLRSVSQRNAQFNCAVQMFEYILRRKPRALWVSDNPLIPWCFGNCYIDEDKMGNKKPVKQTRNGKIDVAICVLEGLIMQEEMVH